MGQVLKGTISIICDASCSSQGLENSDWEILFPCQTKGGGLSYFSIAVIRQHDQGNLEKKDFIWDLEFQSVSP